MPLSLNTWQRDSRGSGRWIEALGLKEGKNKEVWEDEWDFESE